MPGIPPQLPLIVSFLVALTALFVSPCPAAEAESGQSILVLPLLCGSAHDPSSDLGFSLAVTLETLHNKIPALPETYLAHHLASLAATPDSLLAAYGEEGGERRLPEQTLAAWARASGRRFLVSGSCRPQGEGVQAEVTIYDAVTAERREFRLSGTFRDGLLGLKRQWLTVLDQYGVGRQGIEARLLTPETRSLEAWRWLGLALRHWLAFIADRQLGQECREALAAARQAVAADDRYGQALNTLAYILWWERDKEEAVRLFRRALEQDPSFMDAWDGVIGLQFANGREEEARELAHRKGRLRGEEVAGARGRVDAQLADVAYKEGRLAEQGGAWPEALAWYEKGLALRGAARPARTAAAADAETLVFRRAVATAKQALGRSEEALVELRALLALCRQGQGPCASPLQATLRQDLGDLLLSQGRVAEAVPEYRASLACREGQGGASRRPLAESYGRLAAALMQQADYRQAAALLHQAREMVVSELGPGHPESGRIANTLGVLSSQQGKPGEALAWYEQARAITQRHQGADHRDSAALYNNLGLALSSLADYGQAFARFSQALAIYRSQGGADDREVATVCTNLGLLHYAVADYGKALSWFEEALATRLRLLGQESQETADAYHNLGAVQQAMGLAGRAAANAELALAIRKKLLPPHHPDLAQSFNALGSMRFRLGEYEAAQALHEKALAISRQAGGALPPEAALGHYNLGAVAVARHDFDLALAQFALALPLAERAEDQELLWRLFREMSRVAKGRGQRGSAIFWGKQAVNTIQALRRQTVDLGRTLQKGFLADKESAFRELALLLEEEGRFDEALRVIDLLKGEEYFDFIRRDQAEATGLGGQLLYSRAEQGWRTEYQAFRQQCAAMTRDSELAAVGAELTSLQRAMAGESAAQRPTLEAREQGELDALRQTLAASEAGTVALYYLLGEQGVSILLVTPHTHLVRQVAVAADRLRDLVHRFRLRLTSPSSDPRPEAGRLFRILIAPISEELAAAGATRLLLVTDGSLRYLPFAALHDGSGYLAERYAFSLLTPARPSAARGEGGRSLRVAALGASEGGEGFAPLPAVREELDRIVKEGTEDPVGVLPGVVRLDRSFSRAALVEAVALGYPALHLASHFVSRPGTAADSYLLLGDGGHLGLDQLRQARFDLRAVDLLTLSACDTALGQSDGNGRELESLAVLLQRQGAKAVLASLWPVADRSTALFMQTLYASLEQPGLAPGAALRVAQHALLTGDQATSHPYFWAPFVLMGDWR